MSYKSILYAPYCERQNQGLSQAKGVRGAVILLITSLFLATGFGAWAQTTSQPPSGQSVSGASGTDAGEAVLTWSVDDTGGLPLVRSRLRYKERGSGNPWHRINIRSAVTTHTITGLDSGKRYVAQVRVWNAAGGTRWSRNSAPFSPASATDSLTTTIEVPNRLPTVSIDQGDGQRVETNVALELSATANDDGTITAWAWTAEDSAGNDVTSSVFDGATDVATATFKAATDGIYSVTVTVTDDGNLTAASSLKVSVLSALRLPHEHNDASLSSLSLAWFYFDRDLGANVTRNLSLSPAFASDTTNYTVSLARPGRYRGLGSVLFSAAPNDPEASKVVVREGSLNSSATIFNSIGQAWGTVQNGENRFFVTVTAEDESTTQTYALILTEALAQRPTVSIDQTSPQNTSTGTELTLEATGNDPDGGSVTYAWTARRGGNDVSSAVFSAGADTATATFNASDAGAYTVKVTVTDDENETASASLTVNVAERSTQQQQESLDVTLNSLLLEYEVSSGTYEPVALSPAFASGTRNYTASLTRPSDARGVGTVRFTVTASSSEDVSGIELFRGDDSQGSFSNNVKTGTLQNGLNEYRVVVTGTDGSTTETYSVALTETAENQIPTVSIDQGDSLEAVANANLELTATARDPDGGAVTYSWTAEDASGIDVTAEVLDVAKTSSRRALFHAQTVGTYTVTVKVTDDENTTAADSVTITVVEGSPDDEFAVSITPSGPNYVTVNNDLMLGTRAVGGNVAGYFWSASVPDGWSSRRVTDDVLTGVNTATPTFNASAVGEYTIGVFVYDASSPKSKTATARLTVHVIPEGASSDATLRELTVTGNPVTRHPMILVPPFSPTIFDYSVVDPLLDSRVDEIGQRIFFRSTTRPNAVTEDFGIITPVDVGSLNVTATVNQPDATLSGSFPYQSRSRTYADGTETLGEPVTVTALRMTSSGEIAVGPLVPGDNQLIITVTAQDGTKQDYRVNIKRKSDGTTAPAATISGNSAVAVGTDLALDGSLSSDPDGGDLVGYGWYVRGPDGTDVTAAVLGAPAPTKPGVTFNADAAGIYTVILLVVDDDGDSDVSELAVTVGNVDTPGPSVPTFSVSNAEVQEAANARLVFTVSRSGPTGSTSTVEYATGPANPLSAVAGEDYEATNGTLTFEAGVTVQTVTVNVRDDSHDEGIESLRLSLSNPTNGEIADGEGIGWIRNSDPMPAAWLARFGRTVADQALDGIAGRLKATRTLGLEGSLGGYVMEFGPGSSPSASRAIWGASSGMSGLAAPEGIALADTTTIEDLLLGSSFALTEEVESVGGTMAFWGRGAQTRFDGREATLDLDGKVSSGMLGADYSRDHWTLGLALMRSTGDGGYSDRESESMAGRIESSLTAAIPYGGWRASDRLDVWAAAGFGSGETTLKPDGGTAIKTDLDWSMAAAGLRSELLSPHRPAGSLALALISDAMWTQTSSDATDGLVATKSDTSRLRVGLEGSWPVALDGGGLVEPRLEIGARYDGGDAETGTGIDFGGGIAWSDPVSGLSLEFEGRTLVAHAVDGHKDTGYSASIAFDPNPTSRKGLSMGLRRDWGSQATGGVEALFAADPLSRRSDSGVSQGSWTAEAAYGFAAFGGRFASGPHASFSQSPTWRDYSIGWRLTPDRPSSPDLSLGLLATHRENSTNRDDHRIALEIRMRW